jgi:hypothetical protein
MKSENKEIIDRISKMSLEYGKEAALGYVIGILEMNPLDIVKPIIDLKPDVKTAPNLKPKIDLYPPVKTEPTQIVDLNVEQIRSFAKEGSKENKPIKKTFETKHDEIQANKDLILNCLRINKCGLPLGEIVEYIKDISYARVQTYLTALVKDQIVSDTEKTLVHNRPVKKFMLVDQTRGNVILSDHRKFD